VSKKLPGIHLIPVEFEVGGKPATKRTQTLQQLFAPGLARNTKLPGIRDMDFDLVAFPKFKGLNNSGRKADGEAIAPFGDLHAILFGYTQGKMYI
jgi:hypothetical protein